MRLSIMIKKTGIFLFGFISTSALASKAVLLVSLGMPDNTLKAYLKQAVEYHIPIVIRGFFSDPKDTTKDPFVGSYRDTASRIQSLVGKSNQGGVSIDPLYFRAFAIKEVPALVVYDDNLKCIKKSGKTGKECPNNVFDVVFGNVPIEKQLQIIQERSKNKKHAMFAKRTLKTYSKGSTYV